MELSAGACEMLADDLLYGDLFEEMHDGKAVIKTSVYEMEERMKQMSTDAEALRQQLCKLQEQNDGLSKQNEVLIRNISCLFKTAQMEISRKDKQIRSLQEESLKKSTHVAICHASSSASDHRGPSLETSLPHSRRGGNSRMAETGLREEDCHEGGHNNYASRTIKGRNEDAPVASGCTQKQGGHETKHGNTSVASQAENKCREGEKYLAGNGASKHGSEHIGFSKSTSREKSSGQDDETWKRRRTVNDDVDVAAEGYDRRRRGHELNSLDERTKGLMHRLSDARSERRNRS